MKKKIIKWSIALAVFCTGFLAPVVAVEGGPNCVFYNDPPIYDCIYWCGHRGRRAQKSWFGGPGWSSVIEEKVPGGWAPGGVEKKRKARQHV